MIRIGIAGVGGRMGRALVRAVADHQGTTLTAALARPGASVLGADAGTLAGLALAGLIVRDDPAAFAACDAVLDFTSPAASAALAARLATVSVAPRATPIAYVVGTTGLAADEEAAIAAASRVMPVIRSGNMSLGVNLLATLVRRAARALPTADIEVLEMHHRRKVDAPSGTALLLGQAAAAGRDVPLDDVAMFSRNGNTGPREPGAIGFAALRGGSVVGEHQVILALDGERVTLGHIAEDRAIFATGAVAAAVWAAGRTPGLYGMADVLGLSD